MAKERKKLSGEELAVIEDHCSALLVGAEAHVRRLTLVVERTGYEAVRRDLTYWKAFRAAMRQCITTARQRAGVAPNGQ